MGEGVATSFANWRMGNTPLGQECPTENYLAGKVYLYIQKSGVRVGIGWNWNVQVEFYALPWIQVIEAAWQRRVLGGVAGRLLRAVFLLKHIAILAPSRRATLFRFVDHGAVNVFGLLCGAAFYQLTQF